MIDFLRWTIFAVLGTIGGLMMIGNWSIIVGLLLKRLPQKPSEGISFIPLGGLIAAIGCVVCPVSRVQSFAWLPVVIDPGTVIMLALLPVIARKSLRGDQSGVDSTGER
jgi:hypothetical protein